MDQAASASLLADSSFSGSAEANLVLLAALSAGSSLSASAGIPYSVLAALLAGSTVSAMGEKDEGIFVDCMAGSMLTTGFITVTKRPRVAPPASQVSPLGLAMRPLVMPQLRSSFSQSKRNG